MGIYTDQINEMIDGMTNQGVMTSAIAISASVFLSYFIEMYQTTSAQVSRVRVCGTGRRQQR